MNHRVTITALTLVAAVALFGPSLWAQANNASYLPEGAWVVTGTFPHFPTFIWMDTYTADSISHGRSGTILCTLPSATSTASGHGVWERIDKNQFAITAWRIRFDANNLPLGMAKYWGTVTLQTNDTMTGTLNAEFYDLNGNIVNRMLGGTSAGKRIQIQYE